jgi:hypothetical protein
MSSHLIKLKILEISSFILISSCSHNNIVSTISLSFKFKYLFSNININNCFDILHIFASFEYSKNSFNKKEARAEYI